MFEVQFHTLKITIISIVIFNKIDFNNLVIKVLGINNL